jgi:hypothetical protein
MRRRRPLRYEGKLQVINDLINDFMVFNERDDLHLTSTGRAQQRVQIKSLPDVTPRQFAEWFERR